MLSYGERCNIDVRDYQRVDDYPKNENSDPRSSIAVSMLELMHWSIVNGGFTGHSLSSEGRCFYRWLVPMALESTPNHQFIRKGDYEDAETSFKGSISFYLGMLAAQVVFHKRLYPDKGYLLMHTRDKAAFTISPQNGKKPDFIGIDSQGIPIAIVEAKGTVCEEVRSPTVKDAKSQVCLSSVKYNLGTGKAVSGTNLSKHVVCSAFRHEKQTGHGVLQYSHIDPDGDNNVVLTMNYDAAIKSYYHNVLELLASSEDKTSLFHSQDVYRLANLDGLLVGMPEKLYKQLTNGGSIDDANDYELIVSQFFPEPMTEGEVIVSEDGILIGTSNGVSKVKNRR